MQHGESMNEAERGERKKHLNRKQMFHEAEFIGPQREKASDPHLKGTDGERDRESKCME